MGVVMMIMRYCGDYDDEHVDNTMIIMLHFILYLIRFK